MTDLLNSIQNKVADVFASPVSRQVIGAIQQASTSSGVDFSYLLQQASAESSFNPEAEAKTSSATGLFQFIESTWMSMVDRYGDKYGIDADMDKNDLLNLRKDPEIASQMAAEFASENERSLARNWGGDVGATELYFAHFLGAGQASAFLNARDTNGGDPAAVLFPKAAAANEAVFYDKQTGSAKSLDEVYAYFDKKFTNTTDDFIDLPTQYASADVIDQDRIDLNPLRSMPVMDHLAAFGVKNDVPQSLHSLLYNQLDLMLLAQMDLPLGFEDTNNKAL